MISRLSKITLEQSTQLIKQLGTLLYDHDLQIDSRYVNENSIFCAYPGFANDGRKYISDVIMKHVCAIIYEASDNLKIQYDNCYSVNNLVLHVGLLASAKYNNPSTAYNVIGITGTNGKTSISYWVSQAYQQLNKKVGIIGTTGIGVYPEVKYSDSTTPNPIVLQHALYQFKQQHVDIVAMEVSSHSLVQGRVNGINFTTAVFSNLTQDHLDYHVTMENYYLAKKELFYWYGLKNAIINVDDKYGDRLYQELLNDKLPLNIIDYGIEHGSLRASNIYLTINGIEFTVSYRTETIKLYLNVLGYFNIYNVLAVIGVLLVDGYSLTNINEIIKNITTVLGRMDVIRNANKPLVVVDFAHTPDSLEKALLTLKQIENKGRIYCVFGCGGNRDKTKRPQMGGIATKLADLVIITSDNPRYESAIDIINDIISGINKDNYQVIENRELAIKAALTMAKPNDIVLIAGKGHETTQEINGVKSYFSDYDVARKYLG